MVGGDVSAGGVALHAQGRGDGQHSLMLADIPGSKEREATPEGKQGRRHQEAGREAVCYRGDKPWDQSVKPLLSTCDVTLPSTARENTASWMRLVGDRRMQQETVKIKTNGENWCCYLQKRSSDQATAWYPDYTRIIPSFYFHVIPFVASETRRWHVPRQQHRRSPPLTAASLKLRPHHSEPQSCPHLAKRCTKMSERESE